MTENVQTNRIPEKYAKLGVKRGFDPRPPDQLRILVLSLLGRGKSSFVLGDPRAFAFDGDMASEQVRDRQAGCLHIPDWDTYQKGKKLLIEDKKNGVCPWGRAIFDTGDTFMEVLDAHLTAKTNERRANSSPPLPPIQSMAFYGHEGSGWRILRCEMLREIKDFERAGFVWTVTLQIKIRDIGAGANTQRIQTSLLFDTAYKLLCMYADIIMVIDTRTIIDQPYKTVADAKGHKTKVKDGASKRRRVRYIKLQDDGDPSVLEMKQRGTKISGPINIPEVGGWKKFCGIYNDAIKEIAPRASRP